MLYICAKFREIILNGFKVIEWTQFLYGKIQRGIISPKMQGERPLLYISTGFVKLSRTVSKLLSEHDFYTENYKGE